MVELAASAEREITLRRDVTRQRQASERTHFQAQLLDSVGEAVIATDSAGTITYWNRAAEQLYGWASEEALGRGIVEVTPAAVSKAQAAEIVGQLAAGQPWSGEFAVMKRDGTEFPAWVTNTPITDASGTVTGIVGVSRDLTAETGGGYPPGKRGALPIDLRGCGGGLFSRPGGIWRGLPLSRREPGSGTDCRHPA
jgi:PAS domain S-box-containing protein